MIIQALFEELDKRDFTYNNIMIKISFIHMLLRQAALTRRVNIRCQFSRSSSFNTLLLCCSAFLEEEGKKIYLGLEIFSEVLRFGVQPSVIVSRRELALMNRKR